jgi:hypothetical protein
LTGLGLGVVLGYWAATGNQLFGIGVGLVLVAGVLLVASSVYLDHQARAYLRSDAIRLAFDPQDVNCVYRYSAVAYERRGIWPWRSDAPVTRPAITVRVRVVNLRPDSLKDVSVKLVGLRRLDGQQVRLHETQMKWMHDDPPSRLSRLGRPLDGDEASYLDIAFKGLHQGTLNLSYAAEHLEARFYANGEYGLLLRATARNDATGVPAPTCTQAFRLWVEHDGSLNLATSTREELGFT